MRVSGTVRSGSRRAAVAASVATTTARAGTSLPSPSSTPASVISATGVPRRRTPAGRPSASRAGTAPTPSAGRHRVPRTMLRQTRWKNRAEVSSRSSRNTPARNGRRTSAIASSDTPAVDRAAEVERSRRRRTVDAGSTASRAVSAARAARSRADRARPDSSVLTAPGSLVGSVRRTGPCAVWATKPAVNGRSRRLRRSRRRFTCGYEVLNTWNPRSSRNPSRRSVRIRPPTPSDASSRATRRPARHRSRAHASPARPAPTTMTSGARRCPSLTVVAPRCSSLIRLLGRCRFRGRRKPMGPLRLRASSSTRDRPRQTRCRNPGGEHPSNDDAAVGVTRRSAPDSVPGRETPPRPGSGGGSDPGPARRRGETQEPQAAPRRAPGRPPRPAAARSPSARASAPASCPLLPPTVQRRCRPPAREPGPNPRRRLPVRTVVGAPTRRRATSPVVSPPGAGPPSQAGFAPSSLRAPMSPLYDAQTMHVVCVVCAFKTGSTLTVAKEVRDRRTICSADVRSPPR